MNSRKFWYFARRWLGTAIITAIFLSIGWLQHSTASPVVNAIGTLAIGATGFIFGAFVCFFGFTEDPRDRRHGEPWDR
jgi:membrane associated rhomboid family serine protease